MKKNISYFITTLLVIHSLVACTLSMDEWIETEENKGYSDIAVEKNDFYSISYQYKDYTRSLTDKIREYIVNVEADSIIYFLDNTPDEWLPQVGGCVVSNCCPEFPMGLIARVHSIEKINGMYKVVTTETDIDDAYEDFDLDMDMDVLSDNGENDNITRAVNSKTRGMRNEADSVSIDWTMYNMITKGHKVKNLDGVATRAVEDEYTEDVDRDYTKSKEEPIINIDESSALGKLVINKYAKKILVNRFSLGLYSVTETHIKKQVQLKRKREFTDITNTQGVKLSWAIGHDFINPPSNEAEIKKATAQFKDWWKNNRDEIINNPYYEKLGLLDKINEQAIVAEIPLPSCPFGIIIRIKPTMDVTAGLFGTGDWVWYTSKSRSITEIIDGKKVQDKTTTNEDDKNLKLPSSKYPVNITGRFNIGGGLEVFIGLGKKLSMKKAAGIGAFGAVTLEFQGDFEGQILGENDLASSDDLISLTAYGEVGGKVLAGDYGDMKFLTKKYELWKGFEFPYYPKLQVEDDLKMYVDVDSEKKAFCDFTLSYKFPSLGVFFVGLIKTLYKPGLYLYKNSGIGGSQPIDVPASSSTLKAGTTYTFHYRSEDESASYTAVPYLKYTPTGEVTLFSEHERFINVEASLTPMVKYLTKKMSNGKYQHWYQTYGDELTDDSPMAKNVSDPQNYNEFECAMPFELFNPSAMHNVWDDFGIKYTVHWGTGKEKEVSKSLMNTCKSPGIYVPRVTFVLPKKADLSKVNVSGELYFIYKGDVTKTMHSLVNTDYKQFLYRPVTYGTAKGYETMESVYHFQCPFEDTTTYEWESEKSVPMTINTN